MHFVMIIILTIRSAFWRQILTFLTFAVLLVFTTRTELFRHTLTKILPLHTSITWPSRSALRVGVNLLCFTRITHFSLNAHFACRNILASQTLWFTAVKPEPTTWPKSSLFQNTLNAFLDPNLASSCRILLEIPHLLTVDCILIAKPIIPKKRLLASIYSRSMKKINSFLLILLLWSRVENLILSLEFYSIICVHHHRIDA